MADLYESATFAWAGQIANIFGLQWFAQTFTPAVTHNISSVILALGRPAGDTPGTVTVSIRAVYEEGIYVGEPITPDLCSGTTNGNTVPELGFPTPAPEEREIIFSSQATLIADTQYAIVVRAPSGTSSNKLYWSTSNTSVYAGGVQTFNSTGGSNTDWFLVPDKEQWFEEYGDPAVPEKATNPSPTNTATGVTLNRSALTWTQGSGADTENIYFGLSGNMELVESGNTNQSFSLASYLPLPYNTTYQWRIDSVNIYGTTTGNTWSFTTLTFTPPNPTSWKLFKRLCGCANNKFWYEGI